MPSSTFTRHHVTSSSRHWLLVLLVALTTVSDVITQIQIVLPACVSWTVFDDQHSAFAVNYWQYKTLVDCQAFCASYPPCIAIDFDSSDTPCWVHTDLSNLQPDLTFPNPDVSQFIIRRDCQRKPICVRWTSIEMQNSLHGIHIFLYTTLTDCLSHCVSNEGCVAVDFDTSDKPCWIHTDISNLAVDNTYHIPGISQYRISRTCSGNDCVRWTSSAPNSIYGVNVATYKTLTDCLEFCASQPLCLAVDFDTSSSPCRVHYNAANLLPSDTGGVNGVTRFIVTRQCSSNLCVRWSTYAGQRSLGGVRDYMQITSAGCRDACERLTSCVAVDWRGGYLSCWLHTSVSNLSPSNSGTWSGFTQYRLDRTCSTSSAVVCGAWTSFVWQNSLYGIHVADYTTLADCLSYCVINQRCVAVDFDSTDRPCWIHTDVNDLTFDYTYHIPGISQFILNRSCSAIGCPRWTSYMDQNALFAVRFPRYSTPSDCRDFCSRLVQCVAVDFDNNADACWLHFDSANLRQDNIYHPPNVAQFVLDRRCAVTETTTTVTTTTTTTSTSLSTTSTVATTTVSGYTACYMRRTATSNSDGGQLVGRRTETACREQCVALYPHCVAVDYRLSDGYCYTQKTTTGGQWNECCTRYEIFCGGPSGTCVDTLVSYLAIAPAPSSDRFSVAVSVWSVEQCQSECLGRGVTGCAALAWNFSTTVPSHRRCVLYTRPVTHVIKGNDVASLLAVRQTCTPVVVGTKQTTTTAAAPPGFCGLDIAFVVDTSGSIRSNQPRGVDNLQLIKSFLTDIVRSPSLSIARHLDRIALVTFEATAQIIFDLHTRTRLDQVLIGIKLIPEPYGETNTPDAINIARQLLTRYRSTDGPNRRKVMLLLTDGQVTEAYRPNFLPAIARLNTTDIFRFAVGVTGDVMIEQLNAFAMTSNNVRVVQSFTELAGTVSATVNAILAYCGRVTS